MQKSLQTPPKINNNNKKKKKTISGSLSSICLFKLFLLFFLQVVGGGGRSGFGVPREGSHGDNLGGFCQTFGGVLLHVVSGDYGDGGAALLVLVSLDVL